MDLRDFLKPEYVKYLPDKEEKEKRPVRMVLERHPFRLGGWEFRQRIWLVREEIEGYFDIVDYIFHVTWGGHIDRWSGIEIFDLSRHDRIGWRYHPGAHKYTFPISIPYEHWHDGDRLMSIIQSVLEGDIYNWRLIDLADFTY